jgi:beta-1,4-mannosyltransferase
MLSSTSWTPDEDFNILLNSIIQIEGLMASNGKIFRKVLFLITGKGPMKEQFMKKVEEANLKYFTIKSIWLDSDDYPKILGAADLGICLHYSSSGYDLPMKVVDMFAADLPVCAIYYPTIKELVKDRENGFLFKNQDDLAKLLFELVVELSVKGRSDSLDLFRTYLEKFKTDWITQWRQISYPVVLKLITNKSTFY